MVFFSDSEHKSYENLKDMSNRFCLLCKGKTYIDKKGSAQWHIYKNGFICRNCYKKKKVNRYLM